MQLTPGNTLGAAFIGNIAVAVFYGITSVQTYLYYQRCGKDHIIMRSLIFLLWILDTLHLIFVTHSVYFYCITNFGVPQDLSSIVWSVQANYLSGVLSDVIAMGIYAYRLVRVAYIAKKYKIIYTVILCTLMAVYFASGVAVVGVSVGHNFVQVLADFSWLWYLSFGTRLVADISISASLVVLLRRARSGIKSTDSMVQVLVTYTVDTCIITSALTVAVIIIWGVGPANFAYLQMAVSALLPETMLNSLLALLNSRDYIRQKGNVGTVSIHLSKLRYAVPSTQDKSSLFPSQDGSRDEETFVRGSSSSQVDTKHLVEDGRPLI